MSSFKRTDPDVGGRASDLPIAAFLVLRKVKETPFSSPIYSFSEVFRFEFESTLRSFIPKACRRQLIYSDLDDMAPGRAKTASE